VLGDIFYPTPEFAEHNLARALACQGRLAEAIDRLRRLVSRRPGFCLGYLSLAELALRGERPEAALESCEGFTERCERDEAIRGLVTADHSALCNLHRGRAHAALGDVESARSSLRRCETNGAYGRECRRSLERLPD
jgi:predicted Zn-dependent protease